MPIIQGRIAFNKVHVLTVANINNRLCLNSNLMKVTKKICKRKYCMFMIFVALTVLIIAFFIIERDNFVGYACEPMVMPIIAFFG